MRVLNMLVILRRRFQEYVVFVLLALVFCIAVGNAEVVEASTYLNNSQLATSTFDGNTWVTIISPSAGTAQSNPSSILYIGTSTTADSYSPMGLSGNVWTYPTGTRTRLNQAYSFLSWPNGTSTVVICTAYGLNGPTDWCGYNVQNSYPSLNEALLLPNTYLLTFTKTSISLNLLPESSVPPLYFPIGYETRFINALATGTKSQVNFNVSYFLSLLEINATNRPDTLSITITGQDSTQYALKQQLIFPLTQGTSSRFTSLTKATDFNSNNDLDNGTYTAWFYFWNFENQEFTFANSSLTLNFTVSGGVVSTSTVVTSQNGIFPIQSYVPQTCGLTNLSGCINNAMTFLFIPSTQSLQSFTTLQQTLSSKFPFAYIYDFQISIQSIYKENNTQNSTIAYNFAGLGNLTLISKDMLTAVPYANWVKLTLSSMLWFFFGIQMYRRTLKIFNPAT